MALREFSAMMVIVLCLAAAEASTEGREPKTGDEAPAINLTGLLQVPEGAPAAEDLSWSYFRDRGEIVVLEFWATWCAPCIAAIPHLNQLAEEFKDRPVTFLSITAEDEETVKGFLKRREMKSWVGVDTTRTMQRAYGVRGIPYTVLVDAEGRIAGITHPNSLTAETIENVLAGRPSGLPERPARAEQLPVEGEKEKPIFELRITPLEEDPGWRQVSSGAGRWEQSAISALALVAEAHSFRDHLRIDAPEGWGSDLYAVTILYPPEAASDLGVLLRQVVKMTFGVEARRELRELDVLLLTAPDGAGPGLVEAASAASGASARPGVWTAIGQPVSSVAVRLQGVLREIVVDETGIEGRFDFELRWDPEDSKSLVRVVEEEMGLVLVPGRREIEFLVIEASK